MDRARTLHMMRNILASISAHAETIEPDTGRERVSEHVRGIVKQVQRMAAMLEEWRMSRRVVGLEVRS